VRSGASVLGLAPDNTVVQPTTSGAGTPADAELTPDVEVRLLRAFVERSRAGMVAVVAADGTLRYQFPLTILGYPEGENLGRAVFDFLHPDDLAEATERFAAVVAMDHPKDSFEVRVLAADGSWHSLEIFADNRLDDPTVRGLVLQGHDVTERKDAAERLQRSEARFRSLVQHGHDIVMVINSDRRVSYVSPTVQPILGYDPADLLGAGGPKALAFVHPDDVVALREHFATVVSTPRLLARVELRARHDDGSWRWLEVVFTNRLDDLAVRGVVLNFRDVTERRMMQDALAHQALHDPLTGLPNRALLVDRLEQALARLARNPSSVGVLFLDLDKFKLVNDTHGHVAGDVLLTAVARRLRAAIRSGDTIARYGGDEFVVVCEHVDADELARLAEQLLTTLTEPIDVEGAAVYATVSIGAALGSRGTCADSLLRDADAAMYHAKERGGGTVSAFDHSIGAPVHAHHDAPRGSRGSTRSAT
jgi:diguanylate cyclase (GGDEF)-like protein/PAS domain S-box-containing protein